MDVLNCVYRWLGDAEIYGCISVQGQRNSEALTIDQALFLFVHHHLVNYLPLQGTATI